MDTVSAGLPAGGDRYRSMQRRGCMSCCGSARSRSTNFPSAPQIRATVLFEYTGNTALNIIGPGSRTAYRFDRAGARVLVDRRDLPYFARVSVLRLVG